VCHEGNAKAKRENRKKERDISERQEYELHSALVLYRFAASPPLSLSPLALPHRPTLSEAMINILHTNYYIVGNDCGFGPLLTEDALYGTGCRL